MIEKNINRTFFSEKKAPAFFELCWELKDPKKFKEENQRFYRFLYDDLKIILQHVSYAPTVVEFSKLIVFFGVDDDPEIHDLLSDAVIR